MLSFKIQQGFKKGLIVTLVISILNPILFPTLSLALTNVPQPETSSFEPVDATDMVNLLTGDFTYNIPIIDVPGPEGGYPLSLFYHADLSPEQEASWAGLGWNINPGAINRHKNGMPDDWKEKTINSITWLGKKSVTDWSASLGFSGLGGNQSLGAGLSVNWNSNTGLGGGVYLSARIPETQLGVGVSAGTDGVGLNVGYNLGNHVQAGVGVGYSFDAGAYGGASASYSKIQKGKLGQNASIGISLSSYGVSGAVSTYGSALAIASNPLTASDYSSNIDEFGFALPIAFLEVGFQYKKTTYWLSSQSDKLNYGSIYQGALLDKKKSTDVNGASSSGIVGDYYNIDYSASTYNDEIKNSEQNALSFPAIDFYSVNAQGIGGGISPKYHKLTPIAGQSHIVDIYPTPDEIHNRYKELIVYQIPKNYQIISEGTGNFNQYPVYFDFDYDASGYSIVTPGQIKDLSLMDDFSTDYTYVNGNVQYTNPDNLNFYNGTNNRFGQGKYIEFFTNAEIANNLASVAARGFIEDLSQYNQRLQSELYDANGIGGFSITAEDGKTYHYSIPVYQFEEYHFFVNPSNPQGEYVENRNLNMYAYDWLLTSITGPDYVDRGTIGVIDDADYGYYVQFNYGKWTDAYTWRTPYGAGNKYETPPKGDGKYQYCNFGRKQLYYLNNIKTKTHTAYFIKSLRDDGISNPINYDQSTYHTKAYSFNHIMYPNGYNDFECSNINPNSYSNDAYGKFLGYKESYIFPDINYQLKLDKIILLTNKDAATYAAALSGNNNSSSRNFVTKTSNGHCIVYKRLNYEDRNQNYIDGCETILYQRNNVTSHYQENILDFQDLKDDIGAVEQKALKVVEFNYDYLLCSGTPNSTANLGDKLTLKSVKNYGLGKADLIPPYYFTYANQKGLALQAAYSKTNVDAWGNLSQTKYSELIGKADADAWCLNSIKTPMGSSIQITYESDSYNNEVALGKLKHVFNPNKVSCGIGKIKFRMDGDVSQLVNKGIFKIGNSYNLTFHILSIDPPFNRTLDYQDLNLQLTSIDGNELQFAYDQAGVFKTIMNCKLNIYPTVMYGGGVRVKEVVLNDGLGKNYHTTYNYNSPITNISSGVTSYAPSFEDRYIPYINELPSPQVMYKYVTVEDKGTTGESYIKTRYKFDVLEQAYENGTEFTLDNKLFVRNITPETPTYSNQYSNHWYSVQARTAVVNDNRASIGNILEIVTLNKDNQLQTKVSYEYFNPLQDNYKNGISQETFVDSKYHKDFEPNKKDKKLSKRKQRREDRRARRAARKKARQERRAARKHARQERREKRQKERVARIASRNPKRAARVEKRIEKRQERKENRQHKKEQRKEKRAGKKEARQEKREARKERREEKKRKKRADIIDHKSRYSDFALNHIRKSSLQSLNEGMSWFELMNMSNEKDIKKLFNSYPTPINKSEPDEHYKSEQVLRTKRNAERSTNAVWSVTSTSRKKYPSLLKKITTESNGLKTISVINKYDLYTGRAIETDEINNDGTKYRTKITPAFYSYGGMGSKLYSSSNKNMLVQESQNNVYFVNASNQEQLLSSTVQTWNYNWSYFDFDVALNDYNLVSSNQYVWRKHQSYVWKNSVLRDGSIANYSLFSFSNPPPADPNWVKNSEITLYNHNSLTLESKDINGNYSANKYGRDNLNIIASSSNSSYKSFTHTGFEDLLTSSFFEGEVALNGATQVKFTSGFNAHTGEYMLKIPISGSSGTVPVNGYTGPKYKFKPNYSNEKPRKYRASVWVHKNSPLSSTYLVALIDGSFTGGNSPLKSYVQASQYKLQVGDWYLLTLDFTIPSDYSPSGGSLGFNDVRIYMVNWNNGQSSGLDAYVDDLRIQPADSPVSGYIYNNQTGILSATLDNENFATFYYYDGLGRLTRVDKETKNGVKKVKENEYHYQSK